MLIDEEITLKKLETFLAFMRTGNLARAAAWNWAPATSACTAPSAPRWKAPCAARCSSTRTQPDPAGKRLRARGAREAGPGGTRHGAPDPRGGRLLRRALQLGALSLTVKTVPQLIMGLEAAGAAR